MSDKPRNGAPLCTIIGAGPGLGAALARRFHAGGCRVALVARQVDPLAAIASAIDAGKVRGFAADAGDTASLGTALGEIEAWAGATEILIYNAARMQSGPAAALDAVTLAGDMAVNLGGAVTAVGALLPAMRAQRRGTILFTGGGLALEPYPAWAALAIGKAALRSYGFALQKEIAGEDIRVAVIAICGIIAPGGPFDPDTIADQYWRLHADPAARQQRELVYLPAGADPYYNDPEAAYRKLSQPLVGSFT